MEKPVYPDYNATTPIDPDVVSVMMPFIQTCFGNPSSSYSIGRENQVAIGKAREQVATLINAIPEEITFTSGGTESNNHAIRGAAIACQNKEKHIITSSIEHPAVTNVCRHLASQGWKITWLPVNKTGRVNPTDVESAIRPDTALITIMHSNNEVGTIRPIKEISEIAKHNNILMHGAGQEKGVRPGTENIVHIVALGKACEIAAINSDKNYRKMYDTRKIYN